MSSRLPNPSLAVAVCMVAAIYKQADDQCRRPRESGISPPGSDGGVS